MARYLFPLLACLFLIVTSREPPWADAHVAYDTTQAIIERGRVDITLDGPPYFFTIREGKKYGIASLGPALSLVPSYLAFLGLSTIRSLPREPLFALCAHLSPALLMAGACVLFLRLCQRRGASPRMAVGLTFALALGTICFIYARSPYAEALQTFALVWFVERIFSMSERPTVGGMALLGLAAGVLMSSKLVYVLVLAVAAAWLLWQRLSVDRAGWRRLLGLAAVAFAAFLPFVALALWHNWIKTGSLLRTGYEGQADMMGGDTLAALHGNLFSTGRSIFLYSPPILLGLLGLPTAWRRARRETALLVTISLIILVVSSRFRIWHGGYGWGPRYLAPLTPLVLLFALPWLPEALARGRRRLRRAAVGLLVGAGVVVQLLGASFYWDHYIRIAAGVHEQTRVAGWSEDHHPFIYYVPEFSPIGGHAWLLGHWLRQDKDLARDAPWREIVTRRILLDDAWNNLRLDWWAHDWLLPPRPAIRPGVIILVLLFGGLALPAVLLARRLRRPRAAPSPASTPGVEIPPPAAGP